MQIRNNETTRNTRLSKLHSRYNYELRKKIRKLKKEGTPKNITLADIFFPSLILTN